VNIIYKERQFTKVLSMPSEMYDDLWTAAKAMYKLEPVVADGGTLIIYAPHLRHVSFTHGELIDKIGYHIRDYFLKYNDKLKSVPGTIKAHSTHVKGAGTFENGMEKPRINVVLATRVPKERCQKINLGYHNPDDVELSEWQGREDEGILLVKNAGEVLYRFKKGANHEINHSL
jgi:nickel-dependent lactate racemase